MSQNHVSKICLKIMSHAALHEVFSEAICEAFCEAFCEVFSEAFCEAFKVGAMKLVVTRLIFYYATRQFICQQQTNT